MRPTGVRVTDATMRNATWTYRSPAHDAEDDVVFAPAERSIKRRRNIMFACYAAAALAVPFLFGWFIGHGTGLLLALFSMPVTVVLAAQRLVYR